MEISARVMMYALVLALAATGADAQDSEGCPNPKEWRPSPEELRAALRAHEEWYSEGGLPDPTVPGRLVLCNADLRRANLTGANLTGAALIAANLSRADLAMANLAEARLYRADMSSAYLLEARLTGAHLAEVDLRWSQLSFADFSGAELSGSNLSGARLLDTRLRGTQLTGIDLGLAEFAPQLLPPDPQLFGIRGLTTVKIPRGQDGGINMIRTMLKSLQLSGLVREATYAIEHSRTLHLMSRDNQDLNDNIIGLYRLLLFEWTVGYGLYPMRALIIIMVLSTILAFVYVMAIAKPGDPYGKTYIYRLWPDGRIVDSYGSRLSFANTRVERVECKSMWRAYNVALYFSILSAFRIGWGSVNIAQWIELAQSQSYTLRANGWARKIAGIQSGISLYLFILALGKYFGLDISWE